MKLKFNPVNLLGIGVLVIVAAALLGHNPSDPMFAGIFRQAQLSSIGSTIMTAGVVWFVVRLVRQMKLTGLSAAAAATDHIGTKQPTDSASS